MKMTLNFKGLPIKSGAASIYRAFLSFFLFPKYGNGILAGLRWFLFLFALKDAQPWEGFKIGFLTGFVAHVGILYWIANCCRPVWLSSHLYRDSRDVCCFRLPEPLHGVFRHGNIFWVGRGYHFFYRRRFYGRSRICTLYLLTGFPWENLAHPRYLYTNKSRSPILPAFWYHICRCSYQCDSFRFVVA